MRLTIVALLSMTLGVALGAALLEYTNGDAVLRLNVATAQARVLTGERDELAARLTQLTGELNKAIAEFTARELDAAALDALHAQQMDDSADSAAALRIENGRLRQEISHLEEQLPNFNGFSAKRRPPPANEPAADVSEPNIVGGNFRYDHFSWRVGDDNMLRFQGELTNLGATAWTVAIFQFDAYAPNGELVRSIPVMINNLPAHETKSFDAYSSDEVGTQSKLTFKVHFNGGSEE